MFKILSSSVGTAIAPITKEFIKHSILDGILPYNNILKACINYLNTPNHIIAIGKACQQGTGVTLKGNYKGGKWKRAEYVEIQQTTKG